MFYLYVWISVFIFLHILSFNVLWKICFIIYIYVCTHTHTHTHTIHTLTHSHTHTIGIRMCQDVLAKQALLEQIMSEKSVLRTRLESESIRNTDLEVCVCVCVCMRVCIRAPQERSLCPQKEKRSLSQVSCQKTNLHP